MIGQLRNAGKAKGRPQHHCTPGWLVRLERQSLVGLRARELPRFDFDPASNRRSVVGAVLELTKDDDGLRYSWQHGPPPEALARARGRWREHPGLIRTAHCNPPWEHMDVWMPRIAAEGDAGLVMRAVVPLRPHRNLWRWPEAICYLPPVAFEGSKEAFPGPVVCCAWGEVDEFLEVFEHAFPGRVQDLRGSALRSFGRAGIATGNRLTQNRVSMAPRSEPKIHVEPYQLKQLVEENRTLQRALRAAVELVLSGDRRELDELDHPELPPSTRIEQFRRGLAIEGFVREPDRLDHGLAHIGGHKPFVRLSAIAHDLEETLAGNYMIERVAEALGMPKLEYEVRSERLRLRALAEKLVHSIFGVRDMNAAELAPEVFQRRQQAAEQSRRDAEAKKTAKKKAGKKKAGKKASRPSALARMDAAAKKKAAKKAAKKAGKKGTSKTGSALQPSTAAAPKPPKKPATNKPATAAKKAGKKPAAKKASKTRPAKSTAKPAEASGTAAIDTNVRAMLWAAKAAAKNHAGPETEVGVEDLATKLKVSRPTVLRSLARLREAGEVRSIGGGRSTRWVFAKETHPGNGAANGRDHSAGTEPEQHADA